MVVLLALLCNIAMAAAAQPPSPPSDDTRTQYPRLLQDSYISGDIGWFDVAFSAKQLEGGVRAAGVSTPHVAARVVVFGHEFNQFLSVQATYLRPVHFVTYHGLSIDGSSRHVWTFFGGATVKGRIPLHSRVSVYGEGGLGMTSRHGFNLEDVTVVPDAHYASLLAGGGLEYHVSRRWDFSAGVLYSPGKERPAQPPAIFVSSGIRYTIRPLPADRVIANRESGHVFPAHVAQIEYSTSVGYAVNTFVSEDVPIFWGGNAKTDAGVSGHYEQNVFHTRKLFALDMGTSVGWWRSRADHQQFVTLSAYPLFRFTVLRRRPADVFIAYSLAGPTYISRTTIDGLNTGHHFTFQDFMGVGLFVGARRRTSVVVKINHFSNGNIFTENAGVKIPLTIGVGRTF